MLEEQQGDSGGSVGIWRSLRRVQLWPVVPVPNQHSLEVGTQEVVIVWTVVAVSAIVVFRTTTCSSKAMQRAVHPLPGVVSGAVLRGSFVGLIHTCFYVSHFYPKR